MNPGTEVRTEYRWPYDCAHPDCWQEPWKGILLAPNDPRAWKNTVRFPGRLPEQAEVDQHLADLRQRDTPLTGVPVLYDFDGEASVQWEATDKVVPYQQCLLHWRVARSEKRDTEQVRTSQYGLPSFQKGGCHDRRGADVGVR